MTFLYGGRILRINLTERKSTTEPVEPYAGLTERRP